MKKKFIYLILLFVLIITNAYAQERANYHYRGQSIADVVGGVPVRGSIHKITDELITGDTFTLFPYTDTSYGDDIWYWIYDETSEAVHNPPFIIQMYGHSSAGRWIYRPSGSNPCDPTESDCYDYLPENVDHPDPPADGIIRYLYDGGYWIRKATGDPIQLDNLAGDNLGSATSFDVSALYTGEGYINTDGTAGIPSGDGLGNSTASEISMLFSGEGDYLKSDGTRGTPDPGGITLPSNCDVNDILVVDNNLAVTCMAMTEHSSYAELLSAFVNSGLNSFSFVPNNTYPRYVQSSPTTISFNVTDTSPTYTIDNIKWQLDGGGYGSNNMTNTVGDTWEASIALPTETTYVLKMQATDTKEPANVGESINYNITLDSTDPVVDLSSLEGTHTGVGGTMTLDWSAMVTETYPDYARYQTKIGEGSYGEWISWPTPWNDLVIQIPLEEDDFTVNVEVYDFSGRVGSDVVVKSYYSPEGTACNTGWYGNSLSATGYDYWANEAGLIYITRVPISCSGTITGIRAWVSYFTTSTVPVEFAIYADNGSGTDPGALLGNYGISYDILTNTGAGNYLIDSTIDQLVEGDPQYVWIAIQAQHGATSYLHYSATTGGVSRWYQGTSGVWPSTWPINDDGAFAHNFIMGLTFDE